MLFPPPRSYRVVRFREHSPTASIDGGFNRSMQHSERSDQRV